MQNDINGINGKQYYAGRFGRSDLFAIPMDKFKTCAVAVFISDMLSSNHVTLNSLLPAVLRRGTRRMPEYRVISENLEKLFGCAFDCGVTKKGDLQTVYFYAEMVSEAFLPGKRQIFEDAIRILTDVVSEPLIDNMSFNAEYLRVEKDNLSRIIDSRINDKIQYSVERCFETMYAGEPFSLYEYGSKADIGRITGRSLYDHYIRFMSESRKAVFITGRFGEYELSLLKARLEEESADNGSDTAGKFNVDMANSHKADVGDGVPNMIRENMDIGQAKLCIGFKTGILPDTGLYYPLVVCNSILGGGIHSKLFRNVREKASLAYYIFSRLEKFKGAIVAAGGIDEGTSSRVRQLVLEQVAEIAKGNVSGDEADMAVKAIETGIRGIQDSQLQVADYYYGQYLYGIDDTLDDAIDKIKRVKSDEVSEAACAMKPDKVYLLSKSKDTDSGVKTK